MGCIEALRGLLSHKWAVLTAWQVCAVDICVYASLCTGIVELYGSSVPFFMVTLAYTSMLLVSMWKVPKAKETSSWYGYLAVALLTIAGDYTAVLAYNMTSMATALVLSTTVVFWVAPISFFVFKRKLSIWQWMAIFIGIGGGAMIMVADGVSGSHWTGNLLALASAICYAILTVTEEYLVHNDSLQIYLFRFAVIASPIGWILTGAVNWKQMRDYQWDLRSIAMYLVYGILLCTYNCMSPFIMQHSDATTMNISLLTANFYALGVSILVFKQEASWFYLIGFCCIPAAIAMFSWLEKKEQEQTVQHGTIESVMSIDREVEHPLIGK